MLYYLGAMQVIIRAIARLLKFAMETSPMESFATSAHIFVGQVRISLCNTLTNFLSQCICNTHYEWNGFDLSQARKAVLSFDSTTVVYGTESSSSAV